MREAHRWSGNGFGLSVLSDHPLLVPAREPSYEDRVELRRLPHPTAVSPDRSGAERVLWDARFPDGAEVEVVEGARGEHIIAYGEHAVFALSRDRGRIEWAAAPERETAVQRFLLDTVLWWTSLSIGFDLLHVSAVELPTGVVAIAGPSGVGKTSVAIALMARGAGFYSDDVLAIRRLDAGVLVHPGPALMNVPYAMLPAMSEHGQELASFPDQNESWMAIDRRSDLPERLQAVFLLKRLERGTPQARRLEPSPLPLMAHAWGLHNAGPRAQASFENYAKLAHDTAIYDLSCGSGASPETIAETVLCSCEDQAYAVQR